MNIFINKLAYEHTHTHFFEFFERKKIYIKTEEKSGVGKPIDTRRCHMSPEERSELKKIQEEKNSRLIELEKIIEEAIKEEQNRKITFGEICNMKKWELKTMTPAGLFNSRIISS